MGSVGEGVAESMSEGVEEGVAELRRRFFEEKRGGVETGKFAVEDVRRLRSDDAWLAQFLERCDGDLDVTLPILTETLKWRQDFGLHRLSPDALRPTATRQAMYIRGRDREGVPLLWFNVRHQKKDELEVRQILTIWLEKQNRERPGQPLVIVFDMSSTGLQNMDLDLVKFLLHCLKFHFPGLLDYLLVYEIPWVLSAAWKLVKTWLDPAAQKKIVFVGKGNIQEYVAPDQLPLHIGGSDDYRFSMEDIAPWPVGSAESAEADGSSPKARKSVKFADGRSGSSSESEEEAAGARRAEVVEEPPSSTRSGPLLLNGGTHATLNSSASPSPASAAPSAPVAKPRSSVAPLPLDASVASAVGGQSPEKSPQSPRGPASPSGRPKARLGTSASQRLAEMAEWRLGTEEEFHDGPLLSIAPRDALLLQAIPGEQDRVDAIVLRNKGPRLVAFKVKITSPERFRVRPSLGVVKASAHAVVKVYLQPGHDLTVHKDKFLVQSMALDSEPANSEELGELWKANSARGADSIVEHRLKCKLDGEGLAEGVSVPVPRPSALKAAPSARSPGPAAGAAAGTEETVGRGVVAELRSEMSERDRVVKVLLVLLLSLIVVLFVHQRLVLADIQAQLNSAKDTAPRNEL